MSHLDSIMRFHKRARPGPQTLDQFHEWNVKFALRKFKAKRSNDEPVTFFNFRRSDTIQIMETPYRSPVEKRAVFLTVRQACQEPSMGVEMVSMIAEVWIASAAKGEDIHQYPSVRETPGRDDGLMVSTYSRDGGCRMTRWVVRLKANPANNIMLARDDVDITQEEMRGGQAVDFFNQEREVRP